MRTFCLWCHAPADFIDTVTTKCPECFKEEEQLEIEKANLVSRQTKEGVQAYLRACRAIHALIERRKNAPHD